MVAVTPEFKCDRVNVPEEADAPIGAVLDTALINPPEITLL